MTKWVMGVFLWKFAASAEARVSLSISILISILFSLQHSFLLWAHAPEATPRKPLRPLANEKNVGPSSSLAGPIQAFY
jgi:hypothetical protein